MRFLKWRPKQSAPTPAVSPREAIINLADIPGALVEKEGFSHIRVAPLESWINENLSAPRHAEAWSEAAAQWLGRIKRRFGGAYALYESPQFLALSALPVGDAKRLVHVAEQTYKQLLELRGEPPERHPGKLAIIHLRSIKDYYDYISTFYKEEGDYATTSGMFIHAEYHHVALPGPDFNARTLTHELTHALVVDLELPLWLNEGLAQMMEGRDDAQRGIDPFQVREIARDMALWGRENLNDFWSGKSFRHPEFQRPSYLLSRLLVRHMVNEFPARFREFLINASHKDSGRSAARDLLDMNLEAYAESLCRRP